MMTAVKTQALKFTLPGAPKAWSQIVGLPGLFHPDHPMPLTEVGVTAELAELWSKDPGCPVKLVDITQAQADAYVSLRKAGQ